MSHLYAIFYSTFSSTLLYTQFNEIKPLGKISDLQCQNRTMSSRRRPRAVLNMLFFVSVILILRISNFFLHLVEITLYQKKVSQFNTSQKKLFYEIFVYKISVREMVWKLSILTLKLLNVLKRRQCFKERWQILRASDPKIE